MASWHDLDTRNPKTFPRTLNFNNKAIEKSSSFRYYIGFKFSPLEVTEGCPKTVPASWTLHHCTLLKKVYVVGRIKGVVKMDEINHVTKFELKSYYKN